MRTNALLTVVLQFASTVVVAVILKLEQLQLNGRFCLCGILNATAMCTLAV